MIEVGIVGSRKRKTEKDRSKLYLYLSRIGDIDKIVTGDCSEGGDDFARNYANEYEIELDVKRIKDPSTGEEMDFNNHKWFPYFTMCNIFYARNKEIAEEDLDFLVCRPGRCRWERRLNGCGYSRFRQRASLLFSSDRRNHKGSHPIRPARRYSQKTRSADR